MNAEQVTSWLDHSEFKVRELGELVLASVKDEALAVVPSTADAALSVFLMRALFALAESCATLPGKLLLLDARSSTPSPDDALQRLVEVLRPRVEVRVGRLADRLISGPTVTPVPTPQAASWSDPAVSAGAAMSGGSSSAPVPHVTARARRGWSAVQSWPGGAWTLRAVGVGGLKGPELDEAALSAFVRLAEAAPSNLRRPLPALPGQAAAPGLLLDLLLARGDLERVGPKGAGERAVFSLDAAGLRDALLVQKGPDLFVASCFLTNDDPSSDEPLRQALSGWLSRAAVALHKLESDPTLPPPHGGDWPRPLLVIEKPVGADADLRSRRNRVINNAVVVAKALGASTRTVALREHREPGTSLNPLFRQLKEQDVCAPLSTVWHRKGGGAKVTVCFGEIENPLSLLPFTAKDVMQAMGAILRGPPPKRQDLADVWKDHTNWLQNAWVEDEASQRKFDQDIEECGTEALAYYRFFHNDTPSWGIYMHMDAFGLYAHWVEGQKAGTDFECLEWLEVFAGLILKTLFHEWHHHVEEVSASAFEILKGKKLFKPWFKKYYKPGWKAINESLANADAIASLRSCLLSDVPLGHGLNRLGHRVDTSKAIVEMAKHCCTRSPGTYGDWANAERDSLDPRGSSKYDQKVAEWLAQVLPHGASTPTPAAADGRVAAFHGYRAAYASSYTGSVAVRFFSQVDQRRVERVIDGLAECWRRGYR